MVDNNTAEPIQTPSPRYRLSGGSVLVGWVVIRAALEGITQFGPTIPIQAGAHVIATVGDVTVVAWQCGRH